MTDTASKRFNPTLLWSLCLVLMAAGLLLSGYLSIRTIAVRANTTFGKFDVCSTLFSASCDDTLDSASSWLLGIPLAGWGLIYFAAAATLLLLARVLRDAFARQAMVGVVVLNIGAVATGAWLSAQFLRGVPFCPLCVTVHLINLGLLPFTALLYGHSPRDFRADITRAVNYLMGANAKDPAAATWRVIGFLAPALVAVIAYQALLIRSERAMTQEYEGPSFEDFAADFRINPAIEIAVDDSDPRRGPEDAPVEVIVFSSMQCPACQLVSQVFDRMLDRGDGTFSLVYKQFPMGDCNPIMNIDMQPMACEMADASVAAQAQGKFWEFHDRAFAGSLKHSMATMRAAAEKIGLDIDRFEADRTSSKVRDKVRKDAELGASLSINETPAIYINGRRVPGKALRFIEDFIQLALEEFPHTTP